MYIWNYLQFKYYNNIFYLLNKNLIGKLIKRGRKLYAWKLYFILKYLLKKKIKKDVNIILLIGLIHSLRKVHFIKKRFGSVKKEIPVVLKFERQIKFALNSWLKYVKSKPNNNINLKRLVLYICASYKWRGPIIKENYILYKKAIENRILLNFIKK